MEPYWKRTWIDIDLDKLKANYRTACSLTESLITCVIKSNAYGHGAVRVAQALQEEGCRSFAVSCAREAMELRKNGITGEVFVMGLCEEASLPRLVRENVTLTVVSLDDLKAVESAAAAQDQTAKVQIKVNTGFHRLGFECTEENANKIAALLPALPHVVAEGLFTHLGLISTERDVMQHDNLMQMHAWLADRGVQIDDVHICDSIGLVRYPDWHHSRCRAGAFLFGVRPYRSEHLPFDDYETLTFNTTVAQVRDVAAGEVVGYGDDMIFDHPIRVATLCAGYGDGYPRCLSNGNGKVLIHGKRAQVVGLVCMDQMMVDVTDIPDCQPGDTVTLLGGGIGYMEYSNWVHSNRNECITIMSRRPVRVYHENGRIVTVLDSLLDERTDY